MSGPTLRSLHAALRQSHRRISVRSLQPAWTQQPGESFRCLREGGATTSWNRNRSMATGQPRLPSLLAQIQTQAQTQAQTQSQSQAQARAQARLGQRTEQSRGYATLPALAVPLASILQEMSAAAAPSQPSVYATVHIYGRPYLVTAGDRLRLPFRMAGVQPGDILHLDRVGVVGSRSVTAVGGGSGPEGEGVQHGGHVPGVSVTAVVLGLEAEPLRVLVKKKRRNRRKRTVRSKHQYTVLRIQDVHLGDEST